MNIIWLYYLNTAIFCFPLWKQFKIIVRSPEEDPNIYSKVLFFVSGLALIIAMWFCYFRIRNAAWLFFLVIIVIASWTYNYKPKIKK